MPHPSYCQGRARRHPGSVTHQSVLAELFQEISWEELSVSFPSLNFCPDRSQTLHRSLHCKNFRAVFPRFHRSRSILLLEARERICTVCFFDASAYSSVQGWSALCAEVDEIVALEEYTRTNLSWSAKMWRSWMVVHHCQDRPAHPALRPWQETLARTSQARMEAMRVERSRWDLADALAEKLCQATPGPSPEMLLVLPWEHLLEMDPSEQALLLHGALKIQGPDMFTTVEAGHERLLMSFPMRVPPSPIQAVPLPEPETLETLLSLWDPDSMVLSSLESALVVAQEV